MIKWCRKQKVKVKPSLERQSAEKLLEIGTQLYQARQTQALSLERVAMKTMIPRRLLKAIEAGNREELPEPIYIQSYIKQYADALGLDGTELARNFPVEEQQLQFKSTQRILPAAQLRPIHLYLLYLFVIFWAVNALSHTLSRNQLQDSSFQRVQQLLPTQTRSPQTDLQSVSTANHDSKPVKVSVTLKAQSWLRVTADGQTAFEGTLPQGTQRTWEAEEELTLKTENAGGVLVQFNQEKARQIGNPGQMQEVTFAANQQL